MSGPPDDEGTGGAVPPRSLESSADGTGSPVPRAPTGPAAAAAAPSSDGREVPPLVRAASRQIRLLLARTRLRQGLVRARAGLVPIAQAALAAGASYLFAGHVLHHPQPFFAPIAAWACLGFTAQRSVRTVAELAIAVGLGVGAGDLVVHFIGTGWWQILLVLLMAALVARIVGPGALLTMQAGTQAIVIVGLPAASGGPLGRWTDALVGGAFALLVAVLMPGDTRRRPRALAGQATTELAETLELLARGLRAQDADLLVTALVRGRASEPVLDEWASSARSAHDLARVSVGRAYRDELSALEARAVLVDRAMRTVRVLARRAPSAAGRDLTPVADVADRFAAGTRLLASALATGGDPAAARGLLLEAAAACDPHAAGGGDWHVQSLVMLLRSPIVDALEAAGVAPDEARAALPEL